MNYNVFFYATSKDVIVNDRKFTINKEQYEDIVMILNSNPETYESVSQFIDDDLK